MFVCKSPLEMKILFLYISYVLECIDESIDNADTTELAAFLLRYFDVILEFSFHTSKTLNLVLNIVLDTKGTGKGCVSCP